MTITDAVILGLVQGVTEFLPISSTGHLIFARDVLGLNIASGLAIDATLHFATAFAVILYFRKDLLALVSTAWMWVRGKAVDQTQKVLLLALVVGTIPALIVGLWLQKMIETTFRSASLVAWVLIAGSGLFLLAEYVLKLYTRPNGLTLKRGFIVGLFQTLALVPGMSRSGASISGGMLLGLTREASARFAFLLSIPIIVGAGSLKLFELGEAGIPSAQWITIALAALVAFASGMASIHYLLKFLKSHTLYVFVVYRIALAIVVLYLVV